MNYEWEIKTALERIADSLEAISVSLGALALCSSPDGPSRLYVATVTP